MRVEVENAPGEMFVLDLMFSVAGSVRAREVSQVRQGTPQAQVIPSEEVCR